MTWSILSAWGIPSALVGLVFWYIQKKISENEKKTAARQKDLENLVIMMMKSTRANTKLCIAIGETVRDGHCNGNMTSAMELVEKVQKEEKDFMLNMGVKHIFE